MVEAHTVGRTEEGDGHPGSQQPEDDTGSDAGDADDHGRTPDDTTESPHLPGQRWRRRAWAETPDAATPAK